MIRKPLYFLLSVLVFAVVAAPAFANAPNPVDTRVVSVVPSGNGATVTVMGTWQWGANVPSGGQKDCNDSRSGIGYAIAWNDPNDPGNEIPASGSQPAVFVGDTHDNWVHSVSQPAPAPFPANLANLESTSSNDPSNLTVFGPISGTAATPTNESMAGTTGDGFAGQGIPSNQFGSTGPTSNTDANTWFSNCGPTQSRTVTLSNGQTLTAPGNSDPSDPKNGFPSGFWGPISHTYSGPGPYTLCAVMYDPHGGPVGSKPGGLKDVTAGGNGFNDDNSVQKNGNAPASCPFNIVIPGLKTAASPATTIGSSITDSATIDGSNPQGTLTWHVYGPFTSAAAISKTSCTSANLATSTAFTAPVNGNTGPNSDGSYSPTSPSSSFTPTTAGVYQWTASFTPSSSDLTNQPVGPVGCGDSTEQTTVGPATPAITTTATPASASVGSTVRDSITITGGSPSGHPSGTVTWQLVDSSCTAVSGVSSTASVDGSTSYPLLSPAMTAPSKTGIYYWTATFTPSNANNTAVGPVGCNPQVPSEKLTITQVPGLTTSAVSSSTVGNAIAKPDSATISGTNPQGTITWHVYGPFSGAISSSSCTAANETATGQTFSATVNGNGTYTPSASFTPTTAGVYQWTASFTPNSSDTFDQPAGPVGCGETAEQTTVGPATPTIATTATPSTAAVGTKVNDSITISGGFPAGHPSGTVTWQLVDSSCNAVSGVSSSDQVGASTNYPLLSPDMTAPNATGTYYWTATFTPSDGNNTTVGPVGCNVASEKLTVTSTPQMLVTKFEKDTTAGGGYVQDPQTVTGAVGDTIDYKMEVDNLGNVPLTLSNVTDPNCDSHNPSGPFGSDLSTPVSTTVAPGASVFYTCDHILTSHDIGSANEAGTGYTNLFSVTGTPPPGEGNPINGSSHVTAFAQATPAMTVTKFEKDTTANGGYVQDPQTVTGAVGDRIDYKIEVDNPGNVPLTLTNATDPKCDSGSANGPFAVDLSTPVSTTVPAGGSVFYTCDHILTNADIGGGGYTNTFTVTGNPPPHEGTPITKSSSVTAFAAAVPGFTISKAQAIDGSGQPFTTNTLTGLQGQKIDYQITVSNTGNVPETLSNFTDAVCDAGTIAGGSTSIPVGGSTVFTCSHVITATDQANGSVVNSATVTGTPPGGPSTTKTSNQVTVLVPSPGITILKQQRDGNTGDFTSNTITGNIGDTINYKMIVSNTGGTSLTLTLNDPHCDSGTVTGPFPITGSLSGATLAAGGQAYFLCSHVLSSADVPSFTNTATSTGTPPSGPPVTSPPSSVVVNVNPPSTPPNPGMNVVKSQTVSGSNTPYTTAPVTANVGQTVLYHMTVTNTGNEPLKLDFSDPHCDAGTLSGPSGGIDSTGDLAVGAQTVYSCSHLIAAGDAPAFTNVVTVTGTPPTGPSTGPLSSSVVANVPAQAVQASCVAGTVALQGTVGCARKAFQAVVAAAPNSIKSVTFFLDGKKIRTLTHVGQGNKWALTINPAKLKFGGHTLTAHVTLICKGTARTVTLHFRHCKPPAPRFTG